MRIGAGRIAAVLAGALLLIPVMAWASGATEKTASTPAVTLSFYYPVGVSGPLAAAINGYVAAFNKTHPSIKVDPVFAGSYTESYSKTLAAIRGGTPPGVAILLSQNLNDLLQQGVIIPLDKYIAESPTFHIHDFFPSFLLNARENGHIWSIPYQRSTPVMFYNKQEFQAAGLNPNQPPTTWDQLISYAQRLTKRSSSGTVTQWGIEIPSSGGVDTWLLEALTIEAGSLLYNAQDSCCTIYLDAPAAKAAFHFLRDLGTTYKVSPPGPVNWGTAPSDFIAGKVAMIYHSTGSLGYIRANANFPFGAAFLPKDKRFGVPTGGGDFYLFKETPAVQRTAAWRFIEWMTSTNRLAKWSIASGYVAPRISSWETPLMTTYVQKYPQALIAKEQMKYAHAELPVRDIIQVKRQIVNALQSALTTNEPIDSIVADAQARINAILK